VKLASDNRFRLAIVFWLFSISIAGAATQEIPAWFSMSAKLQAPPQVNVPVEVEVSIEAIIGDLNDVQIDLLVPAGWAPATPTARAGVIEAGKKAKFSFTVTPNNPLPNGSIVAEMRSQVPKAAIKESIRASKNPQFQSMLDRVTAMPAIGEGFSDISFALFAEEGFYPLTGDMWICYDDRLKPEGMTRGPVFFRETVITPFQAQTDVEMYDKLERLLKSDPTVGKSLEGTGVDLVRKKADQMLGLYILGTEAFLKGDFLPAHQFLNRLQDELASASPGISHILAIPAGNLRGLVFWAQGDRKAAEDSLRKTFYLDRKEMAQRYVLRNIGLLMLDSADKATAREMFRLALDLKPSYSLLQNEFNKLKKL